MAKQFPIVHGKILRYTICQNFALSTFAGVKNGLLFKVYPGQGWFGKRNIQLKSIHFVNRTAQGSCFHKLKIVQTLFSSTKITQHFQCLKFKIELLRGTYFPHQIHRRIATNSKTIEKILNIVSITFFFHEWHWNVYQSSISKERKGKEKEKRSGNIASL